MDEKLSGTKEEQPTEEKKVYTPPTLTLYGKLTELTAGGSQNNNEPKGGDGSNDPHRRS